MQEVYSHSHSAGYSYSHSHSAGYSYSHSHPTSEILQEVYTHSQNVGPNLRRDVRNCLLHTLTRCMAYNALHRCRDLLIFATSTHTSTRRFGRTIRYRDIDSHVPSFGEARLGSRVCERD